MTASPADLERTGLERDLYLRLLELGAHGELESFLKDALALVVEMVGAREGYLELRDEERGDDATWWISEGFAPEEVEEVRRRVSTGIIAEALSTGRMVTPRPRCSIPVSPAGAACSGPHRARALCADRRGSAARRALPAGTRARGRSRTKTAPRVELIARHLAPIAENFILRRRAADAADHTRAHRAKLRVEGSSGGARRSRPRCARSRSWRR